MKEAQEIFWVQTDLVLEQDAKFAYGMCTMPIVSETKDKIKYLKVMSNPEFYEMIGRVADRKYKDTINTPLAEKVGMVLAKILPIAGQKKKYPKSNELVDES
jgi:hypothetical protein